MEGHLVLICCITTRLQWPIAKLQFSSRRYEKVVKNIFHIDVEAIQRTFTYKISEVRHLNYWETLH